MPDKPLLDSRRYQPMRLEEFSDEELVRDWTLTEGDKTELTRYRRAARLWMAAQLCAVRLYGRLIQPTSDISPRVLSYLSKQLELPPSLGIGLPDREATMLERRKNLLSYLGFGRFDEAERADLELWLTLQAQQGLLPAELFPAAEARLLARRILLLGPTVLERLIVRVCAEAHTSFFEALDTALPSDLRTALDDVLKIPEGQQHSTFQQLKTYPPEASVSSLKTYLGHYDTLLRTGIDVLETKLLEPAFLEFFFKQARRYNAADLKRFNEHKRNGLMVCFLLETRKRLLDHLVIMHEDYVTTMTRESRHTYEKQRRKLRSRRKIAIDTVLAAGDILLDWPDDETLRKEDLWRRLDRPKFKASLATLRLSKRLDERGYGDVLLARYPSLRKYFAAFVHLPFAAEQGSEGLLTAIQLVRLLDSGDLSRLPPDAPTSFVPDELRLVLRDDKGRINRNAWETGLALALKGALRSGDLYLPQSKQHVSFWNLMLSETRWQDLKEEAFDSLAVPQSQEAKGSLTRDYHEQHAVAAERFPHDPFATIVSGKLKLKRDDKLALPASVSRLQKSIDSHMPLIRIERLLAEVELLTGFTRHFKPLQDQQARPAGFQRTLLAALISQATNLGVVSMSASMKDAEVDTLRHTLRHFVREETLKNASAEIVNRHHELPLSGLHGDGTFSSSDAQRFKIRASSLLASYYPRYYGYYEKAIGIYTHTSDQYSVFGTRAISCSPREALYVLDGLLENNTVLQIKAHTTDTHGYTEIIFALCHLLGYDFMPRIRDLKDQQLYKLDRHYDYGVFTPLLTKTVDSELIEEQWEELVRVAVSLKERTAPAHVVVQRLTNSYPADRLSKAFTNLGRIIKTRYILRYLTDKELRQRVQLQLNKGEYRHKLARRIFFADQGAFGTGDYEEIMNKASCLSLVSNAVLYWNTLKIGEIVEQLRAQGEIVEDEALKHLSLLPYKHVVPNGTYFIEDYIA